MNTQTGNNAAHGAGDPHAATLSDRVRGLRLANVSGAPSSGSTWLPWTLCALLAVSTAALAFQAFGKSGGPPAKQAAPTAATGKEGTAGSGDVVLESKGYVIPAHQIQVSPKVAGMVEQLFIEEGKRFKQGDELAILEKTNYEYAVSRAKAAVARAESLLAVATQRRDELKNGNRPEEIAAAKAMLSEATAIRDKFGQELRIIQESGTAATPLERTRIKGDYEAARAKVDKLQEDHDLMVKGARAERRAAAEAEVKQAEAEVEQARAELRTTEWNLGNCTVRAPVTGTILVKRAEKGNLVQPMAFAGSTSLCDMADLSDLEVELSIQERDIAQVSVGQKCRIRPEAYQERAYEGHVVRLMPIADRAKGAITVRVKVMLPASEEQGSYLKPEMGVIVSFQKTEKK